MPVELRAKESDKRIDKIICERFSYAPMAEIFKLFRKGNVKVNRKKMSGKERVTEGDIIQIYVDEEALRERSKARALEKTAEISKKSFQVIYEDDTLLVCNKPSGIAVHDGKGAKKGSTLIDLARFYGEKQDPSFVPHLIHRLDAATSGVILLTKKEPFLEKMIELFRAEKLDKKYVALCYGFFKEKKGTIKASLSRNSSRSHGMNVQVKKGGREAHSEYKVLHQYRGFALVEVKIYTGRTHQIRTHMAHIGHPVVGDDRYGDEKRDESLRKRCKIKKLRLFLHAFEISFPRPDTGKRVTFKADIPAEFKQMAAKSFK